MVEAPASQRGVYAAGPQHRTSKMRAVLALLPLVACLGACAPTKPLKPFEFPPTESKARIKFYDDANRISATLSLSDCGEEGEAKTWRWVEIPAGVRVFVRHRNDTGYVGSSCGYSHSFIPKAGASYISDLKEKVFYCTYELYEQPTENGEKLEIPTKQVGGCRR
ncbi:hypothetical protein M0765_026640 [Variovorax sp. S2]|uniref:hypothetical protein n=1 Tax=Variovorax sp. S12S4 TaxID=3029170 RepID=UPI00215C3B53|nr:hypothetical protein [Variovorax sp. S12S4]MCR8961177.1 hypothetical protein [Variovorax sp. S12S4]